MNVVMYRFGRTSRFCLKSIAKENMKAAGE